MDQCNVEIGARQSAGTGGGDRGATPISGTPRGLELIKLCAKFYANGVALAKPTVQLSYPTDSALNQPATAPSGVAKVSLTSVAAISIFSVVLPSLALTAILWWGVAAPAADDRKDAAREASALSAQAASQGAQSNIVIHKVKTQPTVAAWGGSDGDGTSVEISETD
jgi:hypothetical protein